MSFLLQNFEILLRFEMESCERDGSKYLQRLLSGQKKEHPE
jgi:hypothetical protein